MTIGISKDRLMVFKEHCQNQSDLELYEYLLTRCEELSPWQPIESAPKDKEIVVFAPSYQDLNPLSSICKWHESAGFCVDELRQPTHWQELPPEDPKS